MNDGRVFYEVRDTGIGIAPESAHAIFEDFRQLDSALNRKFGGSGLGLALARRHAHLLGGDINMTSVPGEGSVFTANLPLEFAQQEDRFDR
jgi:signal transduction histidine kinase